MANPSGARIHLTAQCQDRYTFQWNPCTTNAVWFSARKPNGDPIGNWGSNYQYPVGGHNLNKATIPLEFSSIIVGANLPLGGIDIGGLPPFEFIGIPHTWQDSLVAAGRAYEYRFDLSWSDYFQIILPSDFSQFLPYRKSSWIPLE